MAIYSLDMRTITRTSGRSATGAAAYRAGVVITDKRTGLVFDYTKKRNVWRHVTYAPPSESSLGESIIFRDDLGLLWNKCELAETRKNSVVAREIVCALPAELSDAERYKLSVDFTRWLVPRFGVALTAAIHRPDRKGDKRNHHAHFLFSTRRVLVDLQGEISVGAKTRELDDRWSGSLAIEEIRAKWEQLVNAAIAGRVLELVDHRSLKRRGIKRAPRKHLGPGAMSLERKGVKTRAGDFNRRIDREEAAELAAAAALSSRPSPALDPASGPSAAVSLASQATPFPPAALGPSWTPLRLSKDEFTLASFWLWSRLNVKVALRRRGDDPLFLKLSRLVNLALGPISAKLEAWLKIADPKHIAAAKKAAPDLVAVSAVLERHGYRLSGPSLVKAPLAKGPAD